MFTKGLQPPRTQTFFEIFFFSDVASVKKQIIGSPRGAVHTALSNPEHYLQVNGIACQQIFPYVCVLSKKKYAISFVFVF